MYELLMLVEEQKLLTADAIWVSPEMCEIVQMAREGFKPRSRWSGRTSSPPVGFLYFAEPIYDAGPARHDRLGRSDLLVPDDRCAREREDVADKEGMAITLYSSAYAAR